MAGFEAEQVTAVVEADAGALGDDTAAEAPVEAVYERAAVAFGVHGAEVGRVPAGRRLRSPLRSAFRRDALAQTRGVIFRDQAFRRGLRVVPELGVTYLVVQVLEGQLLRLDFEVYALRARASQGGEIEALQDVQHLEGGDALAGRWDLVDPDALVFGGYRLDERRLVGREVFFGQESTGLPGGARDAGGDLTPVEGIGTVYRDGREGGREIHLGEDLTRYRRSPTRQKRSHRRIVRAEYLFVLLPVAGDYLGDGITVLGELPGGLEQARQRLVAEAVHGVLPHPDGTRHGDGKGATLGHFAQSQTPKFLYADGAGSPARAIDAGDQPRLGLVEEQEGVATHAGLHRREDGHRGGHGHARVGGRPPASRTRRPITAAVGCSQATAPPVPKTVERPPASGLLTMVSSLSDTDPGPP